MDVFYKPKEAFEECDIYEWSKRREIQEGCDVNTAVKEKVKHGENKDSDHPKNNSFWSQVHKTRKDVTMTPPT